MNFTYPATRQGWQCPICNKVHAPFVAACDCHERRDVGALTNIKFEYPKITEWKTFDGTTSVRSCHICYLWHWDNEPCPEDKSTLPNR